MAAYDTSFSDTPAHDDGLIGHGGCEMVELFFGTKSHLTDVVPMSAKSDFPEALKEFIRKWGAPNKVMSDNAWEQTSKKVLEIVRNYNIIKHNSEAGKQNQKNNTNTHGSHWNTSCIVAPDFVVCCGIV